MSIIIVYLYIIRLGVWRFILNYNHLIRTLLRLEILSLTIYFLLGGLLLNIGYEIFYLLYFLVIVVCEGVRGLAILIAVTYRFGEDYYKSFNILLC